MENIIIIIVIAVSIYFIYRLIKPYVIRYDTTILFTGGLGSGKSLNSVKLAVTLYRKVLMKYKFRLLWYYIKKIFSKKNSTLIKPDKPLLYSNIPVCLNKKRNLFCCVLTKDILTLKTRIPEYSIVFIDEMPLLVNQFNWNEKEVKYYLCEFIALFRHYVGGYLICNGQSESEIVKQVRAKLNSGYWCFDFQKFLFFFYRYKIIHFRISENNTASLNEFVEDNIKYTYGILPKGLYASRTFKNRYKNIKIKNNNLRFTDVYTNKIVRFDNYVSPCDDLEEKEAK